MFLVETSVEIVNVLKRGKILKKYGNCNNFERRDGPSDTASPGWSHQSGMVARYSFVSPAGTHVGDNSGVGHTTD